MGSEMLKTTPKFKGKYVKVDPTNPFVISSSMDFKPTCKLAIPEYLSQNLAKWTDYPAFECGITQRTYTHGQIHQQAKNFASGLIHTLGLERRDTVSILLPNMPEYAIIVLGIWNAGLIASTINPTYTEEEVLKQVKDCEAKVIITIPMLVPLVEKVQETYPGLKSVILVGQDTDSGNGKHTAFSDLLKPGKAIKCLKGEDVDDIMNETAMILYSSGTTGVPKGVELTHGFLCNTLTQIFASPLPITCPFDPPEEQDRVIAVLPFFHAYGLIIILSNTLNQGHHCLCLPKFTPSTFIDALKLHRPTVLHLVTPLISFMCQFPNLKRDDLNSTRGIIAGAAPIGKELIKEFGNKFGSHIIFQEGFGMTEFLISTILPREDTKPGSCGVLVPGTTAKIIDIDSGKNLPPFGKGEICVKGPQVMKGYFKNKEATLATMDFEGYLKTGDTGYFDVQGFLFIIDRLKELIKVKGLQVAPAELEDLMRQHPDILDVAVIGIPHKRNGEAPRAFVVRRNDTLKEQDVQKWVEGRVAVHKRLLGGVEFVNQLPKAGTGKILRRVLKQEYQSKGG